MERTMKQMKNDCTGMDGKLADLLLEPSTEPAVLPAKVLAHVEGCERCKGELEELRATMALLDTWEGPEPSPYFLSRLDARMREEREGEPAGWLSRLRARLRYGPGMPVRPLAAMALTIMLLLGGGTYLGVTDWEKPALPQASDAAVVHDLENLASNAKLLDQLETISSTDDSGD